jgi:hypothetical protein
METVHHFGIKLSCDDERQGFIDLGINLEPAKPLPNGNIITSFEIGDDDPRWMAARQLAAKFQITESARTEFTEAEFDEAKAMCILSSSQRGYPEPSEKRGFLAATFDLSDYCTKCGIGRRQVRPFRLKSAPVLKRSVMQLNWIFDEYFVARDVWTAVFEPLGIACWPVVLDRTGEEIESVVQLKISDYAELILDEASAIVCPTCGRTKTRMDLRGFCPEPVSIPAPMFKSTQFFGSDSNAFNRMLISSSLYKEIKKDRLRGVEFYPCGPSRNAVSAPSFSPEPAA